MILRSLAVFVVLGSVVCEHEFFHDLSAILVQRAAVVNTTIPSDFGFTMAYWKDSLVVSAPSGSMDGEVYRCPLELNTNNSISCSKLDIFHTTTYSRENFPDQKFYHGATISTARDYMFTCAPLVTKNLEIKSGRSEPYSDAIGSCFVHNENGTTEYSGTENILTEGGSKKERIAGGTGWNSLAVENIGFIIVAKTSDPGDFKYLNIETPTTNLKQMSREDRRMVTKSNYNIGYGMVAGNFFSNKTVVAISTQNTFITGMIYFLEKSGDKLVFMRTNNKKKLYSVTDDHVGVMFGYSLAAADINLDGYSDLLVGAPLQSENENEVEFGAIHIITAGKDSMQTINDANRKRTIFGVKSRGRFGNTLATSDIDGDSIPEVFVSAPYEDDGVVYILSGHELHDLFKPSAEGTGSLTGESSSLTKQVSELKMVQKVFRTGMGLFGFSLLPLSDIDGNGCNELAIGSPGAASAFVLRCFQVINATITQELRGSNVREKDKNCTVRVCVNMGYFAQSNYSGSLIVNNNVDGDTTLDPRDSSYKINLSDKQNISCKEIIVTFVYPQTNDYEFKTQLALENTGNMKSTNFEKSWVKFSTYSETEDTILIQRRCKDENCIPVLSVGIKWRNISSIVKDDNTTTKVYDVGSSTAETVSVHVQNNGSEAMQACVWVEISGAPVFKPGICSLKTNGYECLLPTPFRRSHRTTFDIDIGISNISNADTAMTIKAKTYENCNQKGTTNTSKDEFEVKYNFSTAFLKDVHLKKENIEVLQLTDLDLKKESGKATNDDKERQLTATHIYSITNGGYVTWDLTYAVIEVDKKSFVKKVEITGQNCRKPEEDNIKTTFTCGVRLKPLETVLIVLTTTISKEEMGKLWNKKSPLNITSSIKLYMDPDKNTIQEESLDTEITLIKDTSFRNSKMWIAIAAIILSLLLLALVTFILIRRGFFESKEKKKLKFLRESVRRRTIRRQSQRIASERSIRYSHRSRSNADNEPGIVDIEVVDDSPFEDVQLTAAENKSLIKAKADVHENGQNNNMKKDKRTK